MNRRPSLVPVSAVSALCIPTALSLALALAIMPGARAQQPAAAEAAAPATTTSADDALLAKALAKMGNLTGIKFKTVEVQDNAMMRRIRSQMPAGMGGDEDVQVEGTWCQGVISASVGEGDQIVRCRGRTLAHGDGGWKLRGDTLPGGGSLPFLFDPQLFFEVLAALPKEALKVAHAEDAKRGEQTLRVLTITLDGDAARDLFFAGAFPRVSGGPVMMRMGGMNMGGEAPAVTVDVALQVDPASGLVHRTRVKAYEENQFAGQMRIAVGGGGGGAVAAGGGNEEGGEEAKEEKEAKAGGEAGEHTYKGGLPVRKLGATLSMVDFDATLSEHDKTFALELDAAAKRLLHLDK